ncbi:MAG TPA: GNAT family N-acetyltransferase [Candidatus Acidoferrum sp.]|jgi:GNAT superfamily N-acetyltransferase
MLVSFRPCRPKDHGTLLRLAKTYYRTSKIPFNSKSLTKALDTLLRNVSQGQAWLMENHKKPVGYALLTYNFDLEYGGVEGMLIDVFVEKVSRNHGIGSLALYEIEDFCRERGIRTIELQVSHHNKGAENFYRRAGFHILERKVLLLEVRSAKEVKARRASVGKRQ